MDSGFRRNDTFYFGNDVCEMSGFREHHAFCSIAANENARERPMTVYALAQFTIHDRARYEAYAARFFETMKGHPGRLLAADENPQVVEGEWTGTKIVLIEFPDEASWRRWTFSPEYLEIAKDRIAATEGCVLLVKGLG